MVGSARIHGQYYEASIAPSKLDLFKSAKYRIWISESSTEIRGIIIRQHGCGTSAKVNGLNHANDLQWQALAKKHNMALMGTEFLGMEVCSQWFNIEGGTGKAFLDALKKLAIITNHPELTEVPWALWGHSGGAYWCTDLLFEYTQKVLCAIPRSGGHAFTMLWNPSVKQVPVLWMAGERDFVDGFDYVKEMTKQSFQSYRRYGALWGVAIDPVGDHGNREGRSYAIRWMDAIITMRLPRNGNKPVQVDFYSYWLGNLATLEVKPANEVKDKQNEWVWLPNGTLAKNWQEFMKTGLVIDSTPPPIPFGLEIKESGDRTILNWNSEIDLESGIKGFNMYRNNVLIAVVDGQGHNFHDAPEPLEVKFQYFLDLAGPSSEITVEAENLQGMKSGMSNAVYFKND